MPQREYEGKGGRAIRSGGARPPLPAGVWAPRFASLRFGSARSGSGPGPGGCRARSLVVVLASLPSARSFFAIPPGAPGGLLGRRSPAPPAVPPSRLAARQGFGVNRSFRAASAVPSGAFGRPLPARPFGRLSALLCSGLPLGPVGPAPPSASWARSRVGRGAFRRGRRGLAALWRLAALLRLCRPRLRRPAWPPFSFPGFVSLGGAGGLCALAALAVTRQGTARA